MSSAATQSTVNPDSIFQTLCAELKPAGELERMLLDLAAKAMYRLRCASAKLLEILENEGCTGRYLRAQRSEAKDRAAVAAFLNQFHKLESRRLRIHRHNVRLLGQSLDRAAAKPDPPEPSQPDDATPGPPKVFADPRRSPPPPWPSRHPVCVSSTASVSSVEPGAGSGSPIFQN